MIIITGGAGFIGSALVWALNKRGEENIIIVDEVDHDEKENNIGHLKYEERIGIKDFRERLLQGEFNEKGVQAILHMGACSDTTETDWEYLKDNNAEYSKDVIRWCVDRSVRCIYASSGATYGDGSKGYSDEHELFDDLEPLNLYGKSKLLVDIWTRDAGYLDQVVGLRYFNVFGPNEYHKEHMRSVIAKRYPEIAAGQPMRLFKSNTPELADGEQKRDFIYVKDAVAATLFFLDTPDIGGVFNVGTGQARTWNDVAKAMFTALGRKPYIEYIDMPENLRGQYQNLTQADISKLAAVGYGPSTSLRINHSTMKLEDAINEYVTKYLIPNRHLGEET